MCHVRMLKERVHSLVEIVQEYSGMTIWFMLHQTKERVGKVQEYSHDLPSEVLKTFDLQIQLYHLLQQDHGAVRMTMRLMLHQTKKTGGTREGAGADARKEF